MNMRSVREAHEEYLAKLSKGTKPVYRSTIDDNTPSRG